MSLTTLATVKAFKNLTGAEHDAELSRLILAVDGFVAAYCGRTLEQATVTEYHSTREGQASVCLRQPPVASLTSIHDDPDRVYGDGSLLDPATDYVLADTAAGVIRFDRHATPGGLRNLKVVYVGGYATGTPERALLEQAAVELVWLARQKGDQALLGLQSKSIGDGSVSTFEQDWPAGVKAILDHFRLRRVA